MSQSLVVACSGFYHNPFLVRIEIGVLGLGKEDINLRRLLLDPFQGSRSNNSNDTLASERVACRRECNDRSSNQPLRVFPNNLLSRSVSGESDSERNARFGECDACYVNLSQILVSGSRFS